MVIFVNKILSKPTEVHVAFACSERRKHKPAPRLFCDICDMFDQHDTDDCPQQVNKCH